MCETNTCIPAGEGPALPPWSPDSDAMSVPVGALVGLVLILLVLALVVLDIVCCKTKRRGQIFSKKYFLLFWGTFGNLRVCISDYYFFLLPPKPGVIYTLCGKSRSSHRAR